MTVAASVVMIVGVAIIVMLLQPPGAPYCLCYETPEQKAELDRLMAQLNEYLEAAGAWHDTKHKKDGRVYNWTPKKPEGRKPL